MTFLPLSSNQKSILLYYIDDEVATDDYVVTHERGFVEILRVIQAGFYIVCLFHSLPFLTEEGFKFSTIEIKKNP